ncbi:MAG TPA: transporter substrate-binding domain-containing protein [Clostridia bacterium]|nr:transporter substrate-binding domain-containing protein [Clostridia bacterium]
MKKIVCIVLVLVVALMGCFALTACNKGVNEIVVFTNAFFAPFEYYDGTNIVGVDVDIMNKVGIEMGKSVRYENKDFGTLINYVAEGTLCDCAAAGFTITDERKEKVNFSVTYYTSIQYVIVAKDAMTINTATDSTECFYWSQLAGKKIGVQLDTTGNIYVQGEISGWEEGVDGELTGTNAECVPYDDAQLAFNALKAQSGTIDCIVVDELPAQYLIKNDTATFVAYPLYYDADTATIEDYGIAVNKNQTELLAAINKVLNVYLADVDTNGKNGIERLVMQHFGLNA